ncbi:MAG: hypothetical protein P9F19_07125 [Candidatus Contendobacter sp.]|nr:hypothetical protein [Candidatus Contendobacter sp.]MDG4557144.1 hypothetical protein [Candidatus Contendobacter sp.]
MNVNFDAACLPPERVIPLATDLEAILNRAVDRAPAPLHPTVTRDNSTEPSA